MKVRAVVRVKGNCNLCGTCVKVCPTDVFKIVNNRLIINEENCIYCLGCIPLCPTNSIEVKALDENLIVRTVDTLHQSKQHL